MGTAVAQQATPTESSLAGLTTSARHPRPGLDAVARRARLSQPVAPASGGTHHAVRTGHGRASPHVTRNTGGNTHCACFAQYTGVTCARLLPSSRRFSHISRGWCAEIRTNRAVSAPGP
jgi:hypothetical protein